MIFEVNSCWKVICNLISGTIYPSLGTSLDIRTGSDSKSQTFGRRVSQKICNNVAEIGVLLPEVMHFSTTGGPLEAPLKP